MFLLNRNFLALLLAMMITSGAAAQNSPVQLYGEGAGDHVKLLWVPRQWPSGLTAFNVQRRSVSGNQRGPWVLLNKTPISPALSRSKDLTNVESDPAALARLREKLGAYLDSGRAKATDHQNYLARLSSNPDAVKALYLPIALDYDFALLNGFGFVDRNISAADGYEYGLFFLMNGQTQAQPAEIFYWKYGAEMAPALPVDIKVVTTEKTSKLEVRWEFDYQTYLARNINGFNVYRKKQAGNFQRLNESPVWASSASNAGWLSYFDENVQPDAVYTYAVAPLSLFGTEGQRQEVLFDPAKIVDLDPPVLRVLEEPVGSTGIRFEWDFPVDLQNLIQGFALQRRENVNADYQDVVPNIAPAARSETDTPTRAGEYYFYRIRLLPADGQELFSNELLIYYEPQIPPPPPTGLRGTYEREGSRQFIQLNWATKVAGDTLTRGYRLYSNFPPDDRLLLEGNIPMITENTYRYEIFSQRSAQYLFAITAIGPHKAESNQSNVARVVTPSQKIPNTNIWPFAVEGNRITLNWEYDAPPDLAGFRIFQDGVQVAGENQLGPGTRQWVSPALEFGKTYQYELQAVTTSGVVSKMSLARTITTEKQR